MGKRSGPAMFAANKKPHSVSQREELAAQLAHIDEIIQRLGAEPETPEASPPAEPQEGTNPRVAVEVVIGTSALATKVFVEQVTAMVNKAYGYPRLDRRDVHRRLEMGDDGVKANRVLHLALLDGVAVGCASSTFQVPWCGDGCGHWGLLAVDEAMQGRGVASQLVAAAERRLAGVCEEIQMEYEYTPGEEFSERLLKWYEGPCGFRCVSRHGRGEGTQFRKCRKPIAEAAARCGKRERLGQIRAILAAELAREAAKAEDFDDPEEIGDAVLVGA